MVSKPIIWSFGGGTQSAAIAVLIAQGKLPTPERCVIADTGRESSETWEYTDAYIRPLIAKVGLEVEIAPHSLVTRDMYDNQGRVLIPAWTKEGQLPTFCSNEWKQRVVRRWLRQSERGYGQKNPVTQWIGFSTNEISRCKPTGVKWIDTEWPLIMGYGLRLNRADCVRLVEDAGLPTPPRSACWMCPFRTNKEWAHQRETQPKDHLKAIQLDELIRKNDRRGEGLYVHLSRVPLGDVDFDTVPTRQEGLFSEMACTSGAGCWT